MGNVGSHGTQIHDALAAYAYCFTGGSEYIGCEPWGDEEIKYGNKGYEQHLDLCSFLGLPFINSSPNQPWTHVNQVVELENSIYRPRGCPEWVAEFGDPALPAQSSGGLEVNKLFTKEFRNKIYDNLPFKDEKLEGFTVSVHIRRGDIEVRRGRNCVRSLPNSHYINILRLIKGIRPEAQITIYTQDGFVDYDDSFARLGCKIEMEKNQDHVNDTEKVKEHWKGMILSDIFIMSKSSFSYVPAIFNKNLVVYTGFWHEKLDNWIKVENPIRRVDIV